MRYGSVCSGIEAATVAWHPLGWTPAFFSEIDPYACAALAHHYPAVPNLGDMTKFKEWPDANIDVLVGGTPCQSFSHAGLRKGLSDPRGNLMLTYGAIAARTRPRWLVWENVPGVLSSGEGRDFGTFLGMLGVLGYGFAYRILDAQYFGLAQRRKRVFVVGHLGDWHPAAAVLFERASLRGDPAPRREEGQSAAPTIAGCSNGGGANGPGRDVDSCESLIPYDLRNITSPGDRANPQPGAPCHTLHKPSESVLTFQTRIGRNGRGYDEDVVPALAGADAGATSDMRPCVAIGFNWQNAGGYGNANDGLGITEEGTGPLLRKSYPAVATSTVRRLTPRECERLQGFPDDYTLVPYRGKPAADAPRYKALGNSMAVPVMNWIGKRIQMVEDVLCTTPSK